MIKGFYSAVSAMVAGEQRQKLLAHNAANLETPGFKEVMTSLSDFMNTSVLSPAEGFSSPAQYVGQLGLGVETAPEITDFSTAALQNTGHNFDLAITNGNGYFRVSTPGGERLTRDGRFLEDYKGQLTTVEGYQVLDKNGKPITLPLGGEFKVNPDGSILVGTQAVGTLGIQVFKNPATDLARDENNKFVAVGKPITGTGVTVQQGFLEASNVNPSELMTDMVTVSRAYQAAQKMVTTQDDLLNQSISSLGHVG